jgi:AcrR family transcriptional regulator
MKRGEQTEEKIKETARTLFRRKGYAAVKTRDIAEAAGINLALLNYYFSSKENLFRVIMMETMKQFMQKLGGIMIEKETGFEEKVKRITEGYYQLLETEPELPLFIMNNLSQHPEVLFKEIQPRKMFLPSVFVQQYKQEIGKGKLPDIPFPHFFANLFGLVLFPYLAAPMLRELSQSEEEYRQMLADRKTYIPLWIQSIGKTPLH